VIKKNFFLLVRVCYDDSTEDISIKPAEKGQGAAKLQGNVV